jgi:hypothetical protein
MRALSAADFIAEPHEVERNLLIIVPFYTHKLAYAVMIGLHGYLSLTESSETKSRGFFVHNLQLLAQRVVSSSNTYIQDPASPSGASRRSSRRNNSRADAGNRLPRMSKNNESFFKASIMCSSSKQPFANGKERLRNGVHFLRP